MKADKVQARWRHQCGQPDDEIQRLEDHVRDAIAVRRLQRVADVAARGDEQPLFRHRWASLRFSARARRAVGVRIRVSGCPVVMAPLCRQHSQNLRAVRVSPKPRI